MNKSRIEEIQRQIDDFNKKKDQPRARVKVLYLDDEEKALTTFKASFRREFDIFTTSSPDEARTILNEHEVEVILTDQRMPNETGVEFLMSILEKHPQPIRILLTGYADINAVTDAINKGHIYQYVNKPYKMEEMLAVIEHSAEVYNLRKEKEEMTKMAILANEQLEFMLRQKLID